MAEAAGQLILTQPAVSEIIAQLDTCSLLAFSTARRAARSPTVFRPAPCSLGRKQLRRDQTGRQGNRIPHRSDQGRGAVGCAQRLSAAIMPQIAERFSQSHPRVVLHIDELRRSTHDLPGPAQT